MGWVEGAVTVLSAWAWPIVILISVFVLKDEVRKLITRLTRFSGAGVEAEFTEEVAATTELGDALAPESPPELPSRSPNEGTAPLALQPTLDDLLREADSHPVGAMVRAWNLVEHAVNTEYPVAAKVVNSKKFAELFAPNRDMVALASRLFRLRSQVVHGEATPTAEEAKDYVTTTWRLASWILTEPAKRIDPA